MHYKDILLMISNQLNPQISEKKKKKKLALLFPNVKYYIFIILD
jgi:hypothetical protein